MAAIKCSLFLPSSILWSDIPNRNLKVLQYCNITHLILQYCTKSVAVLQYCTKSFALLQYCTKSLELLQYCTKKVYWLLCLSLTLKSSRLVFENILRHLVKHKDMMYKCTVYSVQFRPITCLKFGNFYSVLRSLCCLVCYNCFDCFDFVCLLYFGQQIIMQ